MRQFPDQPTTSSPASTSTTFQPVDGPTQIDDLHFAARLVVWAARLWWRDRGNETGSRTMLAQAFTLARCNIAAVAAFDELMLMALHGACRHLDFASHPTRLGRDEQALIDVIAAFQDDAVIGGERALEDWLPPATARLACDAAITLSRALGRAGLYVHPRNQLN